MRTIKISLALTFIFNICWAQSYQKFCFSPSVSLEKVKQRIDFLLLPQDKIEFERDVNCIDLVTSQTREKLITKFLYHNFEVISNQQPIKQCIIEVITLGDKISKEQNIKLGSNSKLHANSIRAQAKSVAQLTVSERYPGQFNADTYQVHLTCIPQNREWFEITLSIRKRGSNLSTVVQTKLKQLIEVGSLIENLQNNNNASDISINEKRGAIKVETNKSKENLKSRFFLKVKGVI